MSREHRSSIGSHAAAYGGAAAAPMPGKRTLTEALPVQLAASGAGGAAGARGAAPPQAVHAAAAHGVSGAAGSLPYLDLIQASFGRHDVGRIGAHQDDAAREGAERMGARAYAVGDRVAFAGAPSLHLAAHEAAHVVQQRGGLQLAGGIGAHGDPHEEHANAVADLVVAGKSAEALLDRYAGGAHAGGGATGATGVQCSLDDATPVTANAKGQVDALLAPPPGSSGVPDIDGYVSAARAMLHEVIQASYQRSLGSLKGRKKLDMKQEVLPVAEQAQEIVTERYGGLVQVASFSPQQRSHVEDYQLAGSIRDSQDLSKDQGAVKDYLRNIMTLIQDGKGIKLVSKYNVDLSRQDNAGPFYDLLAQFYARYSKELAVIRDAAPGQEDPQTGLVYLPMSVKPEDEGNWYFESLQTLIHEYLHVCAHPQYRAVAQAQNETAKKVLIEGFCDYFAMQAWAEHDGEVPWIRPYAETATAEAIAKVVGDDNCRAAYFLGHTELLGLGSWTANAPGGGVMHHVLPHDTIASICAQHRIGPRTLRAANPDRDAAFWDSFDATTAANGYVAGTHKLRIRGIYSAVPPPPSLLGPLQGGSPQQPGDGFVVENEERDL